MANNTFEIIGKLSIGKESEKFKPYKVTTYDSGWANKELLFNVIAGDNRHMLKIKGGYYSDGNGKVFSFSKAGKSDTGEKIKGEKLEISWKDRFKPEILENVAEFKKCVIDLEEYGRRFKLEKALEKFNDGSLTSEEMLEFGTEDISQELENSKNKRKELNFSRAFSSLNLRPYSSKSITNFLNSATFSRISGLNLSAQAISNFSPLIVSPLSDLPDLENEYTFPFPLLKYPPLIFIMCLLSPATVLKINSLAAHPVS